MRVAGILSRVRSGAGTKYLMFCPTGEGQCVTPEPLRAIAVLTLKLALGQRQLGESLPCLLCSHGTVYESIRELYTAVSTSKLLKEKAAVLRAAAILESNTITLIVPLRHAGHRPLRTRAGSIWPPRYSRFDLRWVGG